LKNKDYTVMAVRPVNMAVFWDVPITFRCDIPVVFYKLNTKYNYQLKHNKNYCIMF